MRVLHRLARRALRLPVLLKRAVASAARHDCLNLGQSAAYSAMVALFPALVLVAAAMTMLPEVAPLRADVAEFFERVLPGAVYPLLRSYFVSSPGRGHTVRALVLAGVVSLAGASSVIATLMEGLARAEGVGGEVWSFGQRRVRALLLVPLSLVPLLLATVLVMFGQFLAAWLAGTLPVEARAGFMAGALLVRWVLALGGVAGVTALIYHLGVERRGHWGRTLPGAVVATGLWFVSTLGFGWYVTRFANYSQVYGSLGTGIALLVWLYLVFLSVLVGAEFNVQVRGARVEA